MRDMYNMLRLCIHVTHNNRNWTAKRKESVVSRAVCSRMYINKRIGFVLSVYSEYSMIRAEPVLKVVAIRLDVLFPNLNFVFDARSFRSFSFAFVRTPAQLTIIFVRDKFYREREQIVCVLVWNDCVNSYLDDDILKDNKYLWKEKIHWKKKIKEQKYLAYAKRKKSVFSVQTIFVHRSICFDQNR